MYKVFFLLLLVPFSSAFGMITIQNSDFEFTDFNLNVTTPTITLDSFVKNGTGFTTNSGEDLRYYSFTNASTPSSGFNVRWIDLTSTFANFTVTNTVITVEGNVTGTQLGSIEIDQAGVAWTFTTLNIVDINTGILVEYFFPTPIVPPIFNAIVLSLNSPLLDRLGGVFAITCPGNSTLTGLLTNGTFVCTDMSMFFP